MQPVRLASARWCVPWIAVLAFSGCSLALSGPDPKRPRSALPECDTGKGLVALDGVLATGLAIGALAAFGGDEGGAGAITGLASAAVLAAAIRGNNSVDKCRAAFAEYARGPGPARDGDEVVGQLRRPPLPVLPMPPDPDAGDTAPAPAEAATPAPTPASTRPERAPTPTPTPTPTPAPAPARTPAPAPDPDDRWSDFWMEVP